MINLIPPGAKKRIGGEYVARFLSVWIILGALSFFVSAALLLPTYVLSVHRLQADLSEDGGTQKQQTFDEMKQTLAEAHIFATQLSASKQSLHASAVMPHIEQALAPSISLVGIAIAPDLPKKVHAAQVRVEGRARSRSDLQSFVERLKQDSFWSSVSIPVSDLAPEVDNAFVVTLLVAQKP
jgi:hypothetical protein